VIPHLKSKASYVLLHVAPAWDVKETIIVSQSLP
jgi:hypothetical protein